MPRVQAIVVRDNRVLMVKYQQDGQEWWCLPGGGQEPDETSAQGALRELLEECNVNGVVGSLPYHVCYGPEDETYSFLVDIGEQTPALGHDPDVVVDH
ncbi:MAG: NUDIX hydrolase [Chloroflexi bacterium AL-W]|nr:NUDIX hydrolase [Chloroflexi bacterium AL-N1]NOK67556.1 NUDIX hydrolase [Chloroflexi bacterium AL-N10]NOK75674.1 NUDIX hydrolase [Chloroflexi bacterium AL-N5]NOK82462.1 NUDIX hydrolase [Chloroflexi bacterium AL-W]NOK90307.1 NUDIX hydrolase [Chloroflexi bacterium AL-N15]